MDEPLTHDGDGEDSGDGRTAASVLAMAAYRVLLPAVLVAAAPYWLARMAFSGRYRAGLAGRLGRVPAGLKAAVAGKKVVWLHAVSVGEVLAATRLVAELEEALGTSLATNLATNLVTSLGGEWVIVVSTTTATGQALARERFAGASAANAGRVFWYPLDVGWAVRAYLQALRPNLLVLMESELWPRMLAECARAGIPVAVVNARVSDRSYRRGLRVKAMWSWVLRRVTVFLAQSEEDGRRLVAMGARTDAVRVAGNLKYDVRTAATNAMAEFLRAAAGARPVIVAGSTVEDRQRSEERMVLQDGMRPVWERYPDALLVLAPRHPERFEVVAAEAKDFGSVVRASEMPRRPRSQPLVEKIVVLDTIGDLAAVYGVADIAFVGGSLVARGGHNPLEPARFGVPVVMGPSYENFREIVASMLDAEGIRIVGDEAELEMVLLELLTDREKAMGERGRRVFEAQQGATARVVEALVGLVQTGLVRAGRR